MAKSGRPYIEGRVKGTVMLDAEGNKTKPPSENSRPSLRWLWQHEGQIIGAVIALTAVISLMKFVLRLREYSVFFLNGVYGSPALSVATIGCSSIYLSTTALILLTSRAPKARYHTILPNLLSVVSAFSVYAFGLLEPSEERYINLFIPLWFLLCGSGMAVMSLLYLGRAFSVTPQARRLVVRGPYAIIRHPMYLGNILTVCGLAMLIETWEAAVLMVLICGLQVVRSWYEDSLLEHEVLGYASYRTRVGAFLPKWLFLVLVCCGTIGILPCPSSGAVMVPAGKQMRASPNGDDLLLVASKDDPAACQRLHQKALSGAKLSKKDDDLFRKADDIYSDQKNQGDTLSPECRVFFDVVDKCNALYSDSAEERLSNPETKAELSKVLKANRDFLRAVKGLSGCTSILGDSKRCDTVKYIVEIENKLKIPVPNDMKAALSDCASVTVDNHPGDFIRPIE